MSLIVAILESAASLPRAGLDPWGGPSIVLVEPLTAKGAKRDISWGCFVIVALRFDMSSAPMFDAL